MRKRQAKKNIYKLASLQLSTFGIPGGKRKAKRARVLALGRFYYYKAQPHSILSNEGEGLNERTD